MGGHWYHCSGYRKTYRAAQSSYGNPVDNQKNLIKRGNCFFDAPEEWNNFGIINPHMFPSGSNSPVLMAANSKEHVLETKQRARENDVLTLERATLLDAEGLRKRS